MQESDDIYDNRNKYVAKFITNYNLLYAAVNKDEAKIAHDNTNNAIEGIINTTLEIYNSFSLEALLLYTELYFDMIEIYDITTHLYKEAFIGELSRAITKAWRQNDFRVERLRAV